MDTLDNSAGHDGQGGHGELSTLSGLSVAAAAAALEVSERTVRRWAASGKLACRRVKGPRGLELRILPATAAAEPGGAGAADTRTRQPDTLDNSGGHDGHPGQGELSTLSGLQRRLAGQSRAALAAAAQVQVLRAELRATREAAERERSTLRAECDWLRGRVEAGEQQARELRLLLAREAERRSLPDGTSGAPWWRRLLRRG